MTEMVIVLRSPEPFVASTVILCSPELGGRNVNQKESPSRLTFEGSTGVPFT
jgi:hypothetical protein